MIRDLNISNNSCVANKKTSLSTALQQLLTQCQFLNHLDISGMNLGPIIREIFPFIREAKRLCSVHLSNNDIPADHKALFFNQLHLSKEQAQKDCERQKIEILDKEQDHQESGQARIINHYLLK